MTAKKHRELITALLGGISSVEILRIIYVFVRRCAEQE